MMIPGLGETFKNSWQDATAHASTLLQSWVVEQNDVSVLSLHCPVKNLAHSMSSMVTEGHSSYMHFSE